MVEQYERSRYRPMRGDSLFGDVRYVLSRAFAALRWLPERLLHGG